jgi:hypothetical protein
MFPSHVAELLPENNYLTSPVRIWARLQPRRCAAPTMSGFSLSTAQEHSGRLQLSPAFDGIAEAKP